MCLCIVLPVQIVGFFISLAAVMYSVQSAGSSSRDMITIDNQVDKEDPELPYRLVVYILICFTRVAQSPSKDNDAMISSGTMEERP